MPDEWVVAVATALAAKGAEAVVAGGRSTVGALFRLVRDRFGGDARQAAVLRAAVDRPGEHDRQVQLADMLARVMAGDAVFAQRVRTLWREASAEVAAADHDTVVNKFSGSADKVVQARDISGDITF
jgi:hypothetical protein